MSTCRLLLGDVRDTLRTLPDEFVQCVVTSPPYWGLRDYGHGDQLGLEPTPEEYVANMVGVFRKVRRVLRPDGVLWLNLGDSYNGVGRGAKANGLQMAARAAKQRTVADLKPKDLCGIPWRVAFALQADGWWLRSDIIWSKPNPMPESVTDRPTKAHEYVFLLSKSERYFYDADAIAEESVTDESTHYAKRIKRPHKHVGEPFSETKAGLAHMEYQPTRNARTVWTITTRPFPGAHFATFPPELAEKCILAGSAEGDTVLDPFGGSGTVGMVATGHGRDAILCELNPEYEPLIRQRVGPMFLRAEEAA